MCQLNSIHVRQPCVQIQLCHLQYMTLVKFTEPLKASEFLICEVEITISESEVAQSCPTLCDPVDGSPPGSSVHGILQARILEWVAISFSRGSSRPRDRTQVSHITGRCFNLCTTREALKYKNAVSQKTSYRDTELQIQVLTSKTSREERKPGWKKKGEEAGEEERKGWPYRRLLAPTDTQVLWDFSLGL